MSAASEPAPAWLTALALALALAALSCAGAQEDLCARLVTRFELETGAGRARALWAHGAAQKLAVRPSAGEGLAGLALAAMLAAALRHNGYEDVRLRKPNAKDM